jgi:hypothetical protein
MDDVVQAGPADRGGEGEWSQEDFDAFYPNAPRRRLDREKWLRRYNCPRDSVNRPLYERAKELAVLGRDDLLELAARHLAEGGMDHVLREATWEVEDITVGEVADRLAGRSLKELLDRAIPWVRKAYRLRAAYASPDTPQHEWDGSSFETEDVDVFKLAIGRKLLERSQDLRDVAEGHLDFKVGEALLKAYHWDLLQEQEAILDLYRKGAWDDLHALGELDESDHRAYRQVFPDGNPNYPGWQGHPDDSEPLV